MNHNYEMIIKATAIQVTNENLEAIEEIFGGEATIHKEAGYFYVYFDGGQEIARQGEWLVQNVDSDLEKLSDKEFKESYKKVS